MKPLRALIVGSAVYFGLGLACLLPPVLLVIGMAGIAQATGGSNFLYAWTTVIFLCMSFAPLLWFAGSGLLAGFLARSAPSGALAGATGFTIVGGLAGIVPFFYAVQMAFSAALQNEPDWWAAWVLVAILLGAWLLGILISAGLGLIGGGLRRLFTPQESRNP